jgi:hypothetical protein|tara:strand:+ start:375 stop:557 length:183 start_codon:yes stop_codon:yes gene_type:complete
MPNVNGRYVPAGHTDIVQYGVKVAVVVEEVEEVAPKRVTRKRKGAVVETAALKPAVESGG